jgi:hypothetical protein
MMEVTTQNYFTRYFINPVTYQIVPPTSPAWTTFAENMDAWNRQFLLINDYQRLAQCHAILGDNPALQSFYTNMFPAAPWEQDSIFFIGAVEESGDMTRLVELRTSKRNRSRHLLHSISPQQIERRPLGYNDARS